MMRTATIRDLRTRFPRVRQMLAEEGEVVVTERGRPVIVMRPYERRATSRPKPIDYLSRLRARMPRALTRAQRLSLNEAERGER